MPRAAHEAGRESRCARDAGSSLPTIPRQAVHNGWFGAACGRGLELRAAPARRPPRRCRVVASAAPGGCALGATRT